MGTRVHVAASACLVASGLFMCGLGGALAFADEPPPPPPPGATPSSELLGGSVHADDGDQADDSTKTRDSTKPGQSTKPGETTKPGESTESESAATESESPTTESESPTADPSAVVEDLKPCEGGEKCPTTTTQSTTTPTTTTNGPGIPGPGGGGGVSGSGGGGLPSRWIQPPQMQLPPEAPTVVSAAPGLAVAAGQLPLAPITLPVIVAPVLPPLPVLAPGLGGGGGGPGSPANPALPAAPRAVAAEPPARRDTLPANVGSNAVVPASSYRVGYAEYLRTAGMSQVAALAVPGVAGMLVLTGAGGLLGYRQAKAGHALRAGGTARFVN